MYTIKIYYTTANTESTPISLSLLMHGQCSACQHTFQVVTVLHAISSPTQSLLFHCDLQHTLLLPQTGSPEQSTQSTSLFHFYLHSFTSHKHLRMATAKLDGWFIKCFQALYIVHDSFFLPFLCDPNIHGNKQYCVLFSISQITATH